MKTYKPNLENLQSFMNQSQSSGSDVNWWSLPNGMSSIRILPPWDPTGRVALAVYSHRIEYQDPGSNFKKYSWTCVNRTFGRSCNICAGLSKLKEAGVSTEEYDATGCTYYVNALVMHDPQYDNAQKLGRSTDGLKAPYSHVLMRIPKVVYSFIVSQITSPLVGDITDPANGIDILVTREGSGLNTKYTPTLSPNGHTAIPEEVLSKIDLYNLDEVFGAGFDDERINRMIESLNTSASGMRSAVAQTQQNMGGIPNYGGYAASYQAQIPQPQYQAPAPNYQMPPQPQYHQAPQPQYQASTVAPQAAPAVQSTASATNNGIPLPKCFGKYDPSNVNCVVCGSEIDCKNRSAQ